MSDEEKPDDYYDVSKLQTTFIPPRVVSLNQAEVYRARLLAEHSEKELGVKLTPGEAGKHIAMEIATNFMRYDRRHYGKYRD